jgi:hypothetical protein
MVHLRVWIERDAERRGQLGGTQMQAGREPVPGRPVVDGRAADAEHEGRRAGAAQGGDEIADVHAGIIIPRATRSSALTYAERVK